MFEDVKKSDETITTGDPSRVEDMFGKVDPAPELKSAVQGGKLTPVGGTPAAPPAPPAMPTAGGMGGSRIGPPNPLTNLSQVGEWSNKRSGKGLKIIALVVLALAVTGGAFAYMFFFQPIPEATPPLTNESPTPQNQNTNVSGQTEGNQNTNQAPSIPTNALIDTDGDGLTDLEEEAAGTDSTVVDTDADGLADRDELRVHKTSPLLSDSDNDGLTDRDEIFTWRTDPGNQDSDADTYPDGVEVQNGYDPNGPGRMPPSDQQQNPFPVPVPVAPTS